MSTTQNTMQAIAREKSSKGAVRALRSEGFVPGVIYGSGKEPEAVAISQHTMLMEMNKGGFFTKVHELDIDGKKVKVFPRELQRDPVTDVIMHADFLRFDANRKIKIMVRVRVIDEDLSPGLKKGGVLTVMRNEIELLCRADSIPQELTISVDGLEVGDSAHFSRITLPEGTESTIRDRDFTVASVLSSRTSKMDEDEELEAAGEEGDAVEGEEAATEESKAKAKK